MKIGIVCTQCETISFKNFILTNCSTCKTPFETFVSKQGLLKSLIDLDFTYTPDISNIDFTENVFNTLSEILK